ncbi:MAG UNVERIFIED_CONTAM: hypothetical protein LVQ98_02245 [Rickettsiaceae bacterium]|jgi:hypothetical protein
MLAEKHTHYTEHYTLLNLGLKYVKDLFKATTPTSEATTQLPKAQYQGYANKDNRHIAYSV